MRAALTDVNGFWPRVKNFSQYLAPLCTLMTILQGDSINPSDVYFGTVLVFSCFFSESLFPNLSFLDRREIVKACSNRFKKLYSPALGAAYCLDPRYQVHTVRLMSSADLGIVRQAVLEQFSKYFFPFLEEGSATAQHMDFCASMVESPETVKNSLKQCKPYSYWMSNTFNL